MQKIVFLSYINRSGSTYLSNLLGQHPAVCALPEAEVLTNMLLENPERKINARDLRFLVPRLLFSPKLKDWGLPQKTMEEIIMESAGTTAWELFSRLVFSYLQMVKPKAEIALFKGTKLQWLYQQNPFFQNLGIVLLSIIRDGRAAYSSQKVSLGSLSQFPMSTNVVASAKQWKSFVLACQSVESGYVIRYEDLLRRKPEIIIDVYKHIGVNSPQQLEDKDNSSINIPEKQKHLHKNIDKPPILSRIDEWKNVLSDQEVENFNMVAGKQLAQMKYENITSANYPGMFKLIPLYINWFYKTKIRMIYPKTKSFIKSIIFLSPYA